MKKVEMVINSPNFPLVGNKKTIILKEKDGNRLIAMGIDPFDAVAVSAGIKNIRSTKLHTYDFIHSIITRLGAILEQVLIHEINGENIQAVANIKIKNGSSIKIKCMPSDAISIALKADVPIFITEDLLFKMGL